MLHITTFFKFFLQNPSQFPAHILNLLRFESERERVVKDEKHLNPMSQFSYCSNEIKMEKRHNLKEVKINNYIF